MSADVFEQRMVRLHVYRMPDNLNVGYCFGGGNPVGFLNVDFFDVPWNMTRDDVVAFVKGKRYFDAGRRYLVIAEKEYPTLTFPIEP